MKLIMAAACLIILLLNLQILALASPDHKLGIMKAHKQGCNVTKCGDVEIPFPFGIGPNCFHNDFFSITCNQTLHPPQPFLTYYNLKVIDLTTFFSKHGMIVSYPAIRLCSGSKFQPMISLGPGNDSEPSPYRFPEGIDFVVKGCGVGAAVVNSTGNVVAGCTPICEDDKAGSSVCLSTLPSIKVGLESYRIRTTSDDPTAGCLLVGLGSTAFDDTKEYKLGIPEFSGLRWAGEGLQKSDHANCTEHPLLGMQVCECKTGYEGNPYLRNGCRVPEACKGCGLCVPKKLNYSSAWDDEVTYTEYHCEPFVKYIPLDLVSGILGGLGSLILLLIFYFSYRISKRMKEKKRRSMNFKQNGGLLLQQHISSNELGFVENSVIFAAEVLEKATDNFSKNRILGQGGQGTVYKGMLSDGRIVAIKKPNNVDRKQSREFINEVVILSQVKHRNVVKLVGCCLETGVPLLVYEYVPNGMLSDHLHNPREDFFITWRMRKQIATEIAGSLAYLHSSSSAPIFHRDIKSNNILLDEKFRAKIADFGISRTVSVNQTHLTTNVVGTFGYLDPEYFRSNQFTEKSDVYSFGVVLVELLTGKKAVQVTESGDHRSLMEEFLQLMDSSRLVEILDPFIVDESKDELVAVANVAIRCLSMVGSNRPTMKEVATTLEHIRSSGTITYQASPSRRREREELSRSSSSMSS